MKRYDIKLDIKTGKLNELEDLCKKFNLSSINTSEFLKIYTTKNLLVQNVFKKDKVKILITGDEKIYNVFMKKFNEIYKLNKKYNFIKDNEPKVN